MIAEIRTSNDVRYLYTDYRDAQISEDFFSVLKQGGALLHANPDVKGILSNFTGVTLPPEFAQTLQEMGKTEEYRTAIVGAGGFQKVVVETIDAATKYTHGQFDDEDSAVEWLTA